MENYKGYVEVELNDAELANFYSGAPSQFSLLENQYLVLMDKEGEIDKYCYQNGEVRRLAYRTISNDWCGTIKPRNTQQHLAIDLLQDRRSKVKVIRGVYGSGKDMLMLNQALEYVNNGKFDKIVFIRPNVEVANVPSIGFLPGSEFDKLKWTLGPFYDKVGGEEGIVQLIEQRKLELVPLNYIRGRSFENSIIYVCEGQNMTKETAKLVISRVGEGSELWINADTHQTDKRVFDLDNGITAMVDMLQGNELFGYVYLPKTERSKVAALADLLDE